MEAIINRFPIDLELELGVGFTERTTYTGIYNISGLGFDMSFRVQCSENYYGPNCTTFCEPVEGVYTCDSEGRVVCIQDNRDPTTSCNECLPGWDLSTGCTECLPGYNSSTSCTECLPGRDQLTNCTMCLQDNQDPATSCIQCSENYYGPNCTTFCEPVEGVYTCDSDGSVVCIQDNQDPATKCSKCFFRGWVWDLKSGVFLTAQGQMYHKQY